MLLYIQLVTLAIHCVICWVFVAKFGMREWGAALATNITYIGNYVLTDMWCRRTPEISKTMVPFLSRNSCMNLWTNFRLGLPGAFMTCFEWWCFEILTLFTGLMGVSEIAAEVVVVNIVTFVFMVPLGTSFAASALTGNNLGEGKIDVAKKQAALCFVFNTTITIIIIVLLGIYKDGISNLFTTEHHVVEITRDCMWVIMIYIFFDTIHGVQAGVIRGIGKQLIGAGLTILCYWIIGIPLALLFAFYYEGGVAGLWFGMTLACIILDIALQAVISCTSWENVAS